MKLLSFRTVSLAAGCLVWLVFLYQFSDPFGLIASHGHFFFLGLLGAVIANSTASGGGIVFIPFFAAMGLASVQSLGTSILIQCFGMTAGSISWLLSMRRSHPPATGQGVLIRQLLQYCGIATIVGILVAQYLVSPPDYSLVTLFRVFSVVFGVALLLNAFIHPRRDNSRHSLTREDRILVCVVCFLGGMVTAWISIGVGEWIALYLIFRRYPTMIAVCVGVCVSSIAVLTASIFHVWMVQSVVWEVLLFAAPAAILGGSFAKYLAFRLGPGRLKVFFGIWILVTGLVM